MFLYNVSGGREAIESKYMEREGEEVDIQEGWFMNSFQVHCRKFVQYTSNSSLLVRSKKL